MRENRLSCLFIIFLLFFNLCFAEEIDLENIIGEQFGEVIKIGLTSYNYPKELYIKSINTDISVNYNDKKVLMTRVGTLKVEVTSGAITINGNDTNEIFIEPENIVGLISISIDDKKYYSYRGKLKIIFSNNGILPINSLFAEEYLYSVVSSEVDDEFDTEAIKAQAVLSRTYLYKFMNTKGYNLYNFTDTTIDQRYIGYSNEHPNINILVNETSNRVAINNGNLIHPYYHDNSGGITSNIEDEWEGCAPVEYLKSRVDESPLYSWKIEVSREELSKNFGFMVDSIDILKRVKDRVNRIVIKGEKEIELNGSRFRGKIGYTKIKSTLFDIKRGDAGSYIFEGKGNGHGVGLSQWGAQVLSKKGYKYEEIIKYYFTENTSVDILEKNKKLDKNVLLTAN